MEGNGKKENTGSFSRVSGAGKMPGHSDTCPGLAVGGHTMSC